MSLETLRNKILSNHEASDYYNKVRPEIHAEMRDLFLNQFEVDLALEDSYSLLTLFRKTENNFVHVLSLWNDEVTELVEKGIIDPNDLVESCVEYAKQLGVI